MNKERELKFILTITEKIVSVNAMYLAGIKYSGGRPKPYLYKSPKAEKFEREVREQLRSVDFSEYLEWLKSTKKFSINITFIVKRNFFKRDVQNMDKLLIDVITKHIREDLGIEEFDDSLFISVHFYKNIIPKSSKEFCCVQIIESKDNIRFDQIDKPERFFLGGTCNGTSWRDELIPELEKKGYTYFNPVVPDWTPECIEKENIEKNEKCDTHLYILTPEMKGVYSVAEIINSTWECIVSGRGFVYVGILGGKDEWGEHQYKSLNETLRMINNISSGNSRIKAGFINNVVDILKL